MKICKYSALSVNILFALLIISCDVTPPNEEINITFDKFPIHFIMTEKCENTLDYLINNNMIEKNFLFVTAMRIFKRSFTFLFLWFNLAGAGYLRI